jgi:hypothetical protein
MKMEKKPIQEFLTEFSIEERVPYFGKARLFTLPMSYINKSAFQLPKEVFHFVTNIYIIDSNKQNKYILHINSFQKTIDETEFSDITPQSNKRINILEDPIFLGMNTFVSLEKVKSEVDMKDSMNILVEYGKISPDLYQQLHTNQIVLVSKQGEKEILQFRGNSP